MRRRVWSHFCLPVSSVWRQPTFFDPSFVLFILFSLLSSQSFYIVIFVFPRAPACFFSCSIFSLSSFSFSYTHNYIFQPSFFLDTGGKIELVRPMVRWSLTSADLWSRGGAKQPEAKLDLETSAHRTQGRIFCHKRTEKRGVIEREQKRNKKRKERRMTSDK